MESHPITSFAGLVTVATDLLLSTLQASDTCPTSRASLGHDDEVSQINTRQSRLVERCELQDGKPILI